MIEGLKRINDLNIKLAKFDDEALDQLYLRVFTSNDGELILQDLANRAFVYEPTENDKETGMRALWLSIQSRLQSAVAPKQKEQE